MKSKMSEIDLHRSVADFLGWIVMPPAVWTTFPAGWTAMRTGAAGRLKACGLKTGMPDILVFYDGFAIGIELKTQKGNLSDEQREMFNRLHAAGIPVSVARSVDDVEKTLRTYKIPLRKFSYAPRIEAPEGRRPEKSAQSESRAET